METTINKTSKRDIFMIDPRAIVVKDGFNSRVDFGDIAELGEQIKAQGVLNPVSVIKFKDADGSEKYRLVDGERRYRATMWANENGGDIRRIPALFLSSHLTDEELLIQQLMRNEGKRFNEYESGLAYEKLAALGYTNEEIAAKVGKKRWYVDCCMSHLKRDERIQQLLKENKIEGATVRSVYQAFHVGDKNSNPEKEELAVQEILNGLKNLEAKNVDDTKKTKKKITIGDLDKLSSKTVAVKDTADIKKGLTKFYDYVTKMTEGGKIEIDLDIFDILSQLNDDKEKTIVDILNDCIAASKREAV